MKSVFSRSSFFVAGVSAVALASSAAPAAPLPFIALVAPVACAALVEPVTPPRPVEPVAVAPPAAGPDCIDVDDERGGGKRVTLEGLLVVDTQFAHPSRGKTRPFILRLHAPRCAIGTSEPRVVEVHLASGDGVELKPLFNKHVRVTGSPFAAHTAWHARDVVVMAASAAAL